jgi:hypothetical protein
MLAMMDLWAPMSTRLSLAALQQSLRVTRKLGVWKNFTSTWNFSTRRLGQVRNFVKFQHTRFLSTQKSWRKHEITYVIQKEAVFVLSEFHEILKPAESSCAEILKNFALRPNWNFVHTKFFATWVPLTVGSFVARIELTSSRTYAKNGYISHCPRFATAIAIIQPTVASAQQLASFSHLSCS